MKIGKPPPEGRNAPQGSKLGYFSTLANLPEVSTGSVTNITSSSATCGGNVISNGGDIITARGICWSTSQNPSLNDSHTSEGTGIGYFSSNITGLTAGTTYYVRAYATNSAGTAYGQQTSFTALDLPVVSTDTVTNITVSTATCGGQVTGTGGSNVTARGVCWSTSQNPTINNSHTFDGSDIGSFTSDIVGLSPNTTYYVRAYATNSVGTAYGNEVTFTTAEPAEIVVPEGDAQPCPGTPTVTDHEGNVYNTVKIGNQCWTRENLRTTTSPSTGTYLVKPWFSFSVTGKKAAWYNNDSATYAPMNYGLLYNWNAAVDTFNTAFGETSGSDDFQNIQSITFNGSRRGICPAGWHLPSDSDWLQLKNYMGSQSEYICVDNSGNYNSEYIGKALSSTEGWQSCSFLQCHTPCDIGYNQNPNNASGFSIIPACEPCYARFWSSTQVLWDWHYSACFLYLNYDSPYAVLSGDGDLYELFSVRCLRD